ncbi:MAG: AAA family ATPase [Lachnospiraceae bacterium]|nr:AAA family ATPase [Lachnospiraceae bacterium]
MRTVGLGIQEFEKIRNENLFYVDKTSFIARWYRKHDDITLITRPRRFGKTLTMDMLDCFFSLPYAGRKDLFEGLAISRDTAMMEMQGTVPTIRISFAGLKGKSFMAMLREIAGRIAVLLGRYRYLLNSDALNEDERDVFAQMSKIVPKIPDPEKQTLEFEEYVFILTHIFHFLSIWLFRHHGKKVFIFMDEYDTPIQTAYLKGYYDEAISVMQELFAETFKENEHLGRAVISGITRIAKESLFSDMNNLAVCSVLSGGYNDVFGFTGEEMEEILEEYHLSDQKELICRWYDGFTIGAEMGIYNPWSIVNYLANRNMPPQDYWAQSGGIGLIDHLVRRGGANIKEGLEDLLHGGEIRKNIREDLVFPRLDMNENAVWSLFIAAGYVKPEIGEESFALAKTTMRLTNYEAKVCLTKMVQEWFNTKSGNYMEAFANALQSDDIRGMNEAMQQVVLVCASGFDSGVKPSDGNVQPENFFHALALGMLTCLSEDYLVTSNREAGFGRYDVCVEPVGKSTFVEPQNGNQAESPTVGGGAFAAILEFKVFDKSKGDQSPEDTALRARTQIEEKAYDAELLARGIPANAIRKYGLGFRGKEVVITA